MDVIIDFSFVERVLSWFEVIVEFLGVGFCLFVVFILVLFVGVFGNLFILVVFCKLKKMNLLECIFIGNLVLLDLYVIIVVDLLSIVGKYVVF